MTELLRVFNCGIGMVLAVGNPQEAAALLGELGETAFTIGHVEACGGGGETIRIALPEGWAG